MAQRTLAALWHSLNPLHWPGAASEGTDQELLQAFAQTQQAEPFATLMRRHGPIVFGVCRRVLNHAADAEDAYQATFLILMRKAGSIRGPASLSSWLYQVAYRTALRARLNQRQRQAREQEVGAMRSTPENDADLGDLKAVIDEEMQRLPRKYQLPVLLCCVEGLTRSEASRQLGWREGTVGSRLARGRALLQQRLANRGVAAPAGGLGVLLAADRLQAAVPALLEEATLQAVLHGVGAAPGAVGASAAVTGLVQAVLHETALRQLKLAGLAALLLTAVIGSGAAVVVYRAAGNPPVAVQGDAAPPAPAGPVVPPPTPVAAARVDALGDPLPAGALFRIGTTRLRHNESVIQAGFTPNGKALATSCCDGQLRFWDLATGKVAQSFPVADQTSNASNWRSFALSPDGALAVTNQDGKLCVWEIATGKQRHALEPGYSDALTFLPDGKTLLVVHDKSVALWDVAGGKQVREFETAANAHRGGRSVLSPDGKTLALGYFDRENPRIEIWDVASGKRLQEWKAHTDYVVQVHFTPDSQHLISVGWDDSIILWKAATGAEVRRWTVKRCITTAVAPVGRLMALVTHKNELKLVNWETGAEVRTLSCEALGGRLAFSADGKTLVQAGWTVRFWDVATGAEKSVLPGQPAHVKNVDFHADGRTLAVREDKALRVRDSSTGKELRSFADFDSYLASPDGRTLAFLKHGPVNADDQKAELPFTIRLVDFGSGKELARWEDKGRSEYLVGWSADGRSLSTMSRWEEGAGDGEKNQERVRLWDAASGKELRRWQAEAVVASPDARLTVVGVPAAGSEKEPEAPGLSARVSGPRNGSMRLTETATGKDLAVLDDCSFWIKSDNSIMSFHPVFSPSGRRLLTGGGNTRKIHVWDATTGKRLHSVYTGDYFAPSGGILATADDRFLLLEDVEDGLVLLHTDTGKLHRRLEGDVPARSLAGAFSPDSRLLALPYRNNAVIFWETMTGEEVLRLTGFQGEVNSLAFSADGKRLATGFRDGSALVWDVTGQSTAQAAALSDAETARLWRDLAWADPIKARQAMHRLSAAPTTAAWLTQRLQPVRAPEAQRLTRLIADLDSERFPVRQQAENELEKLETTGPILHQALAAKPSLELRQRLEQLLQKLDDPALVGSRKQALRGIEVLESIGTPAARKLLETLAAGDQSARLTQEAQAAVARLSRSVSGAGSR